MKVEQNIVHVQPNNKLNVIAVVSNPVRYKSRYELFRKFQAQMAKHDVNLICVELAFGAREFHVTEANNPNHVQVVSHSEVWHKENLINLGFSRLPKDWQYAAWVDADITFLDPNWATETVQALQHHKIVQLFQHALDLGPHGQIVQQHTGFGYLYTSGAKAGPGYEFWHPGFAWAITRPAFEAMGSLVDYAICGAADHHMALAWVGRVADSLPGNAHPNYVAALKVFQDRSEAAIKRDIGYVPGTIIHHWHGKKKDRRYIERWDILIKNAYDPHVDIIKDWQGVINLAGNKPQLRDDLRRYFRQRNEDSVDLE